MTETAPTPSATPEESALKDKIVTRLCTVYDPEIPVNIYDLGLIYRIALEVGTAQGLYKLDLDMTLTAPGCPMADELVAMVESVLGDLSELESCAVHLVWDPPWDPTQMSDAARLELNML